MKKFAKLSYDNFIINGEVNERLPLYNEYVENIYPLEGTVYNLNPDFQLKNGSITYGSTSKLKSKQNVVVSNNSMSFNSTNNSYVELAGDIFGGKVIDIEIKFNINNTSKVNNIFTSTPFSIFFDNANSRLCARIEGIKGQYSSIADVSENVFSLTDKYTISKNTWYTLKIYKYSRTVIVLLNDVTVRTYILDVDFNTDSCFIGKNYDGYIEYVNVRDISHVQTEEVSINSVATTGDFSVCFNFKKTDGNYRMIKIGSLELNMTNGYIYVNSLKINKLIEANVLYGLSMGYSNGELKFILYDMNNSVVSINQSIQISISSNTILTNAKKGMFNLVIYNKKLSETLLINLYKKSFKLDKSGDIRYVLDEVNGHDKLKISVGKKYHMQLTRDLKSDCNTIINKNNVTFVDGGIESKNENRKIYLSFSDSISLPSTWTMIYKTKITKLTNYTHYDSLGEGTYWGIEDGRFVIKYIQNQTIVTSYVSKLEANEILNEWIVISLSYQSGILTLNILTSKGVFSTEINKTIPSIKGLNYDLFFGGKNETLYGEAIYRDLSIISNWNVDLKYIENMFRTKISYIDNKLISNVEIIEG